MSRPLLYYQLPFFQPSQMYIEGVLGAYVVALGFLKEIMAAYLVGFLDGLDDVRVYGVEDRRFQAVAHVFLEAVVGCGRSAESPQCEAPAPPLEPPRFDRRHTSTSVQGGTGSRHRDDGT